jgi:hypothetical protein
LGFDVRLRGDHPDFARFHPQRFQKLPHLGGLPCNPRQGFDPGRRFRHGRGRPLLQLGLDRRAVRVESATGLTRLAVLELLDAPGYVGLEVAMEARFGNATQPQDVTIGHPLAAQVEGLHAHLHPWVGMLKPPIP